jgi:hypothetical protein
MGPTSSCVFGQVLGILCEGHACVFSMNSSKLSSDVVRPVDTLVAYSGVRNAIPFVRAAPGDGRISSL